MRGVAMVAACLMLLAAQARAAYITVDLSGIVNSNPGFSPAAFPTGLSTGNQSSPVPFQLATYGQQSYLGVWQPAPYAGTGSTTAVDLSGLGLTGVQAIYALLNTNYGTNGYDEFDVTITGTGGASATFQSIGGSDVRDYLGFTTTTISGGTSNWDTTSAGWVLDMRQFTLPSSFDGQTLTSFGITQLPPPGGNPPVEGAIFAGLTIQAAVSTPEPASFALLAAGLGALGLRRRRR